MIQTKVVCRLPLISSMKSIIVAISIHSGYQWYFRQKALKSPL